MRRHSTTIARESLITRFWAQVRKGAPNECWPWIGNCRVAGPDSYGFLCVGSSKELAHRFSYEMAHGPAAPELVVMHACDNPPCVNPAHLLLGTRRANSHDARTKGRTQHARGPYSATAETMTPFARWLVEQNYTYRRFADLVGVSTGPVQSWATGRRLPSAKTLRRLYERTNGAVTYGMFYGDAEEQAA